MGIHFQGFCIYMGKYFHKFSVNKGIHFDSWAERPYLKLGQVPPPLGGEGT